MQGRSVSQCHYDLISLASWPTCISQHKPVSAHRCTHRERLADRPCQHIHSVFCWLKPLLHSLLLPSLSLEALLCVPQALLFTGKLGPELSQCLHRRKGHQTDTLKQTTGTAALQDAILCPVSKQTHLHCFAVGSTLLLNLFDSCREAAQQEGISFADSTNTFTYNHWVGTVLTTLDECRTLWGRAWAWVVGWW